MRRAILPAGTPPVAAMQAWVFGVGRRLNRVFLVAALALMAQPALAQDAPAEGEISPPAPAPVDQPHGSKHGGFLDPFYDDEDGKLDFSESLMTGGFFPMPVIITEPAVDGGFGVVAQFVDMTPGQPQRTTRRMLGGIKTGNGSYGIGYFQSGQAFDGRVSYKFGIGHGKISLDMYPAFAPDGIEYTNTYQYGIFGSARLHLADPRFSLGPIVDFRGLKTSVELPAIEGVPDDFPSDFQRKLTTGALGFGMHFDSRDNAVTPRSGFNAFVEGKFNSDSFGSDRNFEIYDADVYAFYPLAEKWTLGAKTEVDAARGDFPSFFAPSVDLRGVQAGRYQGSTAWSSEVEVTRQLFPRWSVVGFAGYGTAYAGSSKFFEDSGAVFAGGGGFRYRIARKLGVDAGMDVAFGPDGAIFYIQFGHAWSMGMD